MMRLTRSRSAVTSLAAGLSLVSCSRATATDPKFVSEWMHTLYGAIRVERMSPPVASRLMGYASSALYAGLAGADDNLRPLNGILNGFPSLPRARSSGSYDGTIAAVAAERVVLDSLLREALPTTRNAVGRLADSIARTRTSLGVSEAVRARSDSLGREIGLAIVGWSRG